MIEQPHCLQRQLAKPLKEPAITKKSTPGEEREEWDPLEYITTVAAIAVGNENVAKKFKSSIKHITQILVAASEHL